MDPPSAGPLRFAMVTDTHASPVRAAAAEHLRRVYAAIARRAPDFVLHCGDITDTGLPCEYDLYQRAVPAALHGRIRHVPGNHDVRWDRTAKGLYHERFGPAPYAFDAAGVHFIGFDLTQPLLESGHCGRDGLRWLERDLARLPAATPVLVFQHFPVGAGHDDVDDRAALLDLLADHGVRGILAGHIHREEVIRSHGLTQVTLLAVVNGPVYYWAEQASAGDGRPVLEICRVTVAADGTQARSPAADIPLFGDGHGGHRARVGRVRGPRLRWRIRLAGSVRGGIAVAGAAASGSAETGGAVSGTAVVAASTGGEVAAFRPGNSRASVLWRARVGPVYRGPAVDAAGRTVFVPSADQHLYALEAGTGLVRWRFDAGAPVLSAPALARAGPDREYVVFSAGPALFAVDAGTGRLAWSVPGRGFSAGRAVCDGQRVYTAAADGYARAHDVRTGQEAWSREMAAGDAHHVALYSGWDNVVALGGGAVIVAAVSGSRALEAASGALRWTFGDGAMYPPAVVLGDGTALLASEHGIVSRVRLADGSIVWRTSLGARVQNAGLAVAGDQAWVVPECGGLIGVRLADGLEQASVRFTPANVYSAPAVVDGALIVGDQDGFVYGIGLPLPNARTEDRSEKMILNIGDPESGVRLVAAVDGNQVGGERLDLAAVAQAARVDPAHPGDLGGQGLHHVGGVPVVAEHQDILVDGLDLRIQQQDRRNVMERGHHPAVREYLGGLLGRAALRDGQRVGAVAVEAQRVHAVHHDLADQFRGEHRQQVTVAFIGDRGDDQARLAGGVGVGQAAHAVPDLPGDGGRPVVVAGADNHRVPGHREPAGQAASLLPGTAEDG